MEDTIKVQTIDKNNWSTTLQGFQPNQVRQVWQVLAFDGTILGTICESVEDKYYLNGHPELDYPSLQVAARVLIENQGSL
ncbi:MAG: hypothetical protein RID09_18485 [Coleofasciculus sp. G1-WW12-02]|uniref:hypothetical protein n=1 Tax=unclassified Coleofasciculus TaxID=2692782 RepID=UPI0032F65402